MKVLILTEAGKRSGFGHLTRCIALYQAFKEKGIQPDFFINGDSTALSLLKGVDFRLANWLKDQRQIWETAKNYRVVIVDSYLAKKYFYDAISKNVDGKLVVIDDYQRLIYPKGIVINPSIYGNRLNYGGKDKRSFLLGKDFIILRKEFWSVKKKNTRKRIRKVLITFGGIDHSALIKRIINRFKDRPDLSFRVISVSNKADAAKMAELMLKADICISGGGQTTYELARCGLPAIGICFADNQLLNLENWQKTGFLEFIGRYNNKGLILKIEKLLGSLNYKRLQKMSGAGKKVVDGQGARRIIRKIIAETSR